MSRLAAGPKPKVTAPLDLSGLPEDRAERAIAFIERHLVVPKGVGAGKPVRLREWQRDIVRGVLAPGVRRGLVSVPRGNGKSALAGFLALYALYADGEEGAQVLTVASDERQAGIVYTACRRMVELSPELTAVTHVYKDRLVVPLSGSTLRYLPSEPSALQGWDPSFCVVDELHVVREDTYSAMQLAAGKRERSLLLAISTPAGDSDGIMWRLVEAGREGTNPAFYFREFAAPVGCELDDEAAWREANPALGDFLAADALRDSLASTREEAFRRFRLGQWVGAEGAWLPYGLWATRADPERVVDRGTRVVLGFDGSASGDSTALVGATVEDHPHVFVLGLWENPGDPRWRVPRAEVSAAVDHAYATHDVVELAADPWGWRSEIETWAQRHRGVLEWPTNIASKMAPATDRLYQGVAEGWITHDNDPRLAAHVGHCVAKATPMGDLVHKPRYGAAVRKIDSAIAMIVAVDRAKWHHTRGSGRSAYEEEGEVLIA